MAHWEPEQFVSEVISGSVRWGEQHVHFALGRAQWGDGKAAQSLLPAQLAVPGECLLWAVLHSCICKNLPGGTSGVRLPVSFLLHDET